MGYAAARVLTFTCLSVAALATSIPGMLSIPSLRIGEDAAGAPVMMPMGGVGTWLYNDTVAEAEVLMALSMGARLIDTARTYNNQEGIARAIKQSGVARKELFISTKVPGGMDMASTMAAHEENLKQLEVETVDLLLTHFPCAMSDPPSNCSKAARQETWKALEAIWKSGKARAIGVSHYCQRHLQDIMEIATVKIAVNQQEWHVGMGPDPEGVVSFCKKNNISYQSFSPLCGPCGDKASKELIGGPLVTAIGKARNVSGAQVSLRWLTQLGSPVIPKSSSKAHLHEDLNLFDFTLTDVEMARLSAATSPPSAEPVSDDCKLASDSLIMF